MHTHTFTLQSILFFFSPKSFGCSGRTTSPLTHFTDTLPLRSAGLEHKPGLMSNPDFENVTMPKDL